MACVVCILCVFCCAFLGGGDEMGWDRVVMGLGAEGVVQNWMEWTR